MCHTFGCLPWGGDECKMARTVADPFKSVLLGQETVAPWEDGHLIGGWNVLYLLELQFKKLVFQPKIATGLSQGPVSWIWAFSFMIRCCFFFQCYIQRIWFHWTIWTHGTEMPHAMPRFCVQLSVCWVWFRCARQLFGATAQRHWGAKLRHQVVRSCWCAESSGCSMLGVVQKCPEWWHTANLCGLVGSFLTFQLHSAGVCQNIASTGLHTLKGNRLKRTQRCRRRDRKAWLLLLGCITMY